MAKTPKTRKPKAKATSNVPADLAAKYPHIRQVTKTNAHSKPLRVEIQCQEQYDDKCEQVREIATQDAFQVTRCHSCQREFLKRRRRKAA